MRSFDAAIVGAGPAGLMTALLLARSGASVAIFESGGTFERAYRGETLTPGTQRIIGDIGLGETLRSLGGGEPAGIAVHVAGRTYDIDLVTNAAHRIRQVPQPALLGMLAREAAAAGAAVEMGTRCKSLMHGNGRCTGLRIAHGTVEEPIAARVVVAADGRFSAVRRLLGIELRETPVPYDLLWLSGRGTGRRVRVIVEANQVFVAFPTQGHGMQIGWLIPKGSFAALRAQPFEHVAARVRRALAAAGEAIEPALHEFSDFVLLPTVSQSAQSWHALGAACIGDAAHPMSPVGGQGINVAIADAVVLARLLAVGLRDGAPDAVLDAALAAFEAERRPAVHRIALQQNALPRMLRTFGPERFLRRAGPLASAFAASLARGGTLPAPLRGAVNRFLLGDPPVRANHGPWLDARVPSRP